MRNLSVGILRAHLQSGVKRERAERRERRSAAFLWNLLGIQLPRNSAALGAQDERQATNPTKDVTSEVNAIMAL